jgi:hypothetical protein
MTVTLHFDSVFLCFALAVGVGGMFAIKYWKGK